jgi:hypothetical protein
MVDLKRETNSTLKMVQIQQVKNNRRKRRGVVF